MFTLVHRYNQHRREYYNPLDGLGACPSSGWGWCAGRRLSRNLRLIGALGPMCLHLGCKYSSAV
ncbi:hypothetical protein RSAG8_01520, partial [Rhizoctonia solani AG-8 WAC10335]